MIIGSVAAVIAYVILTWNKRLHAIVKNRTRELDKANKELVSAYKQLKIHNKTQREFIDIAAHELRTPLQPIIGIMNIIRSKVTDSEQQELFDIVIRNAKRLQRLAEDILDVDKRSPWTLRRKYSISMMIAPYYKYKSQIERNNNEGPTNF
jgi:signal transduction histidine kinase